MSESNRKGDVGEAAFAYAAAERGYWTGKMPQDCPYDFVLDRGDGKLLRVQVKYREREKTGCVKIKRVHHKTHYRYNRSTYTSDNIDMFAVYVPDTRKVYLIPITTFDTVDEVTFRLEPPKNNQMKKIRLITEFESW